MHIQKNETQDLQDLNSINIQELKELCSSVHPEVLFIRCFDEICANPGACKPALIEVLAFYVYPNFNNFIARKVTNSDVEKCMFLLNSINDSRMNSEKINEIDSYTEQVRGNAYPHQTEQKIKTLGGMSRNYFIMKLGMPPDRLLQIVRSLFLIMLEDQRRFITLKDLEKRIDCTEKEWQALINKLGLTQEKYFENVKSINDLRHYPIYTLLHGIVFMPSPHHMLETIWELFQVEMEKSDEWDGSENFNKFNDERNCYSENRLNDILKKLFSSEMIRQQISYPYSHIDPTTATTNPSLDGLVVFNDVALIFEVKAGRHFRPASCERKDRNNFRPHSLRDTIGGAFAQVKRFKAFFENPGNVNLTEILKIDCSKVKTLYLFAITFEHLGNFGFNMQLLKEQGDLFADNNYPVAISLDDLEVIVDHCKTPWQFIDYIKQRSEIKDLDSLRVSDELDLFGYYLEHDSMPPINPQGTTFCQRYSYKFDLPYFDKYLKG